MNKEIVERPDSQLGFLLTQVSFLKQRIIHTALKELDITYIQFIILAGTLELSEGGKIVTQQDLSRERRLDKAMVSNVVKTLIKKGMMVRNIHPVDKRAYTLLLTGSGTEAAKKGKKIALEVDRRFFAGINQEELFRTLVILLQNERENEE